MQIAINTNKGAFANDKNFQDIVVEIKKNDNIYVVNLVNKSDETITLNSIEVEILKLYGDGYQEIIIKPEFSDEEYKTIDINAKKINKINSFMFTILKSEDEAENIILGFLSGHTSRNYISIEKNKDIRLKCIYDFVNMEIKPNSSIELDSIYTCSYGKLNRIFNEYLEELMTTNKDYINEGNIIFETRPKFIEENLLFTNKDCEGAIKVNQALVHVDVNHKRYYLNNILDDSVKNEIISKCKSLSCNGNNVIYIRNFKAYINKILELKLFNPYYEISNLIKYIKNNSEVKLIFAFDDVPTALAIGNFHVYISQLNLASKEKFILGKITNKECFSSIDFITKTLLDNNLFITKVDYHIKNQDMKNVLEALSLNYTDERQTGDYSDIYTNISRSSKLGIYEKNESIFSLWRKNEQFVYIGIFNNSKKMDSMFIDLSQHSDCNIDYCRVEDVFSKNQYMIHNSKIYVKNIQPGGCILLKQVSK